MAKIMIVDDDPDLCKTVKLLLEQKGYEVDTAYNADECLNKIKKDRVDLILLDIMMPGMTPAELIRKIEKDKNLSSIKIVYLTVVEFPAIETKKIVKGNVVDYIQKPFNNDDLVRRVKKIVGG